MIKWRRWFIDKLVRMTERELYDTPVRYALDDKRRQVLFATLWDTPGFREHLIERETRIVHAQANKFQDTVQGQRVENALWFQKAKSAWDKREQEAFTKGDTVPPRKR